MAGARRRHPPRPCDADVPCISADAPGAPMRREEPAGRRGKQPDGAAKTRMVMLGCVSTRHGLDGQGLPVRDPAPATCPGALRGTTGFAAALRREALRRGPQPLEKLGREYFPMAVQIVGFQHAMERLAQLVEALCRARGIRAARPAGATTGAGCCPPRAWGASSAAPGGRPRPKAARSRSKPCRATSCATSRG